MAVGERIRWFRKARGMTQRELGIKLGFTEQNADIRVRQYELGQRNPKEGVIKELSRIFDVAEEALTVPDIDNYQGLMHTLFALEDLYGLTVSKMEGLVCLKMDVYHEHYDMSLAQDLIDWYEVKERVASGSMQVSEYDHWRYGYPEDKAKEFKERLDARRVAAKEEQV